MYKDKKIKILFLDIDGVLNVIPQGRDEYGAIFHSHFIDNLKRIIDETGAKIVISSSWRMSGEIAMREMWAHRNLPGEIMGVTPINRRRTNPDIDFKTRAERGYEIDSYLKDHSEITNYVIIDDDDDVLPHQESHFVKTSENLDHEDKIDYGYGLTKICTDKAIEILNKTK